MVVLFARITGVFMGKFTQHDKENKSENAFNRLGNFASKSALRWSTFLFSFVSLCALAFYCIHRLLLSNCLFYDILQEYCSAFYFDSYSTVLFSANCIVLGLATSTLVSDRNPYQFQDYFKIGHHCFFVFAYFGLIFIFELFNLFFFSFLSFILLFIITVYAIVCAYVFHSSRNMQKIIATVLNKEIKAHCRKPDSSDLQPISSAFSKWHLTFISKNSIEPLHSRAEYHIQSLQNVFDLGFPKNTSEDKRCLLTFALGFSALLPTRIVSEEINKEYFSCLLSNSHHFRPKHDKFFEPFYMGVCIARIQYSINMSSAIESGPPTFKQEEYIDEVNKKLSSILEMFSKLREKFQGKYGRMFLLSLFMLMYSLACKLQPDADDDKKLSLVLKLTTKIKVPFRQIFEGMSEGAPNNFINEIQPILSVLLSGAGIENPDGNCSKIIENALKKFDEPNINSPLTEMVKNNP